MSSANLFSGADSDMSQCLGTFQLNIPTNKTRPAKRKRKTYSCTPCRVRKLKCDRGQPCKCCASRQEGSSCVYGEDLRTSRDAAVRETYSKSTPSMPPSPPEESREASSSFKTSKNRPGSTHWSTLMQDIPSLRNLKAPSTSRPSRCSDYDRLQSSRPWTETIFTLRHPISLDGLITQYLPPRTQVDRRLAVYFNARYLVFPLIHMPLFRRQYERFWQNIYDVDPLWLSMLFSICFMGTHTQNAISGASMAVPVGVDPNLTAAASTTSSSTNGAGELLNNDSEESYLRASTEALVLGDYTRPRTHVLEAVILHAQCRSHSIESNPLSELGLIMSVVARLCYQMDYHLDPSHFPSISVFDGEMRRRTWATIQMFDVVTAFHLGLPSAINPDTWDTKLPLNIDDDDDNFDENIKELPEERNMRDPSRMLYFVTKCKLTGVFSKVCRLEYSVRDVSPSEIQALNQEILQVQRKMPPVYRIRKMEDSYTADPQLCIIRLNFELMVQKSLLVLHRKGMAAGSKDSGETCLEAATAIIEIMMDYGKELEPDGQLQGCRWMLGTFALNDMALSIMIVCLSLSQWKQQNPTQNAQVDARVKSTCELLKRAMIAMTDSQLSSRELRVSASLAARVLVSCDSSYGDISSSFLKADGMPMTPDTSSSPGTMGRDAWRVSSNVQPTDLGYGSGVTLGGSTPQSILTIGGMSQRPDGGASVSWPLCGTNDLAEAADVTPGPLNDPLFTAMRAMDWNSFDRFMAFPDTLHLSALALAGQSDEPEVPIWAASAGD